MVDRSKGIIRFTTKDDDKFNGAIEAYDFGSGAIQIANVLRRNGNPTDFLIFAIPGTNAFPIKMKN